MKETYSEQFPIRADIRQTINEVICRIVSENGYETVEIKYFKEYKHPSLTIYVWKKGGIEIDDLETVHNAISSELDLYDTEFPNQYTLNISSPGLDRPIEDDDDYRRNLGEEIEVTYKEDNKREKLHGILEKFNEENIIIKTTKKEQTITKNKIIKVLPYIKF